MKILILIMLHIYAQDFYDESVDGLELDHEMIQFIHFDDPEESAWNRYVEEAGNQFMLESMQATCGQPHQY